MNFFPPSRQQSLFHVLAAYSIYNTVSWSMPACSSLGSILRNRRIFPHSLPNKTLWAEFLQVRTRWSPQPLISADLFRAPYNDLGSRAKLIWKWEKSQHISESHFFPLSPACLFPYFCVVVCFVFILSKQDWE